MSDKKIGLCILPLWNVDAPPLAPAYLNSYLKQNGFLSQIFDFNIDAFFAADEAGKMFFESHKFELWQDKVSLGKIIAELDMETLFAKWADEIKQSGCNVLGFSCYYSNSMLTLYFIDFLKGLDFDTEIIIGGPSAVLMHDDLADRDNICCISGEGEKQLFNFLKGLQQSSDIDSGECYINNLDEIKYPDLSEFDLNLYRRKTLPILMGRGCLFFCTFCGARPLWPKYRSRSAKNVYDEIVFLKEKYDTSDFEVIDAALNCDMNILRELCQLLIDNEINITWGAKAVIRKEMTPEFLALLYESGCRWLAYGIESGSDKVLKDMGKVADSKLCSRVLKDTKKSGIGISAFFIVGYPTETRVDFLKTLWFVIRNIRCIGSIQSGQKCGIPENSKLLKMAGEMGIVFKEDGWYYGKNTPRERERRQKIFKAVVGLFPKRKIVHS